MRCSRDYRRRWPMLRCRRYQQGLRYASAEVIDMSTRLSSVVIDADMQPADQMEEHIYFAVFAVCLSSLFDFRSTR